jgi:HEAT repeat protein
MLLVLFAKSSFGQQAESQFPGLIADERKAKQLRGAAISALRESAGLTSENRGIFEDYYVRCVIAGMTSSAAAANGDLYPEYRKALAGALKATDENPSLHQYFVDTFRENLTTIVTGTDKYSPAARFNAMLALGELDDREAVKTRTSYQPPVPNAAARNVMLESLKTKPDVVHIAALIGLQRHAGAIMGSSNRDINAIRQIAAVMVNILRQETPPEGITKDGHDWMKRIAVETLGLMRSGTFVKYLEPIVTDESAPMYLRCAAAKALGQLSFKNARDVNPLQLAGNLTSVAAKACRVEIDRVKTKAEDFSGFQSRDAVEPRLLGSQEEINVDPIVQQTRRQLIYQLGCVRRGLSAAKTSVANDKPKEDHFQSAISEIDRLVKVLNEEAPRMNPEELVAVIAMSASGLEEIAKVQ